jgi:hypothetical protein
VRQAGWRTREPGSLLEELPVAPEILEATRTAAELAHTSSPSGVRVTHLRLAGLPVRLRVAGPALADQLERCFPPSDDTEAGAPAALTIDAWDRAHTGVGCPGVPFAPDATDALGGGLLKQFGSGAVLHYERARDIAALDRPERRLYFCVEAADSMELHLRSKPFPYLLATWYRDRGVQQLHAALVSRHGRGVLFVGASGSGKSTSALACALAGFDYLGDDYVGFAIEGNDCLGHAFYSGARVDDATIGRFPALAGHVTAPIGRWERKGMVRIPDLASCKMALATRIAAIVIPEIHRGGLPRLTAAPPGVALRCLAPSTLLVPLGAGAPGLATIGALVRRVPCFRMELGSEVGAIPAAIERLLAGLPQ